MHFKKEVTKWLNFLAAAPKLWNSLPENIRNEVQYIFCMIIIIIPVINP